MATRQTSDPPEPRREETRSDKEQKVSWPSLSLRKGWDAHATPAAPTVSSSNSSLAELFGYFEHSESNTLALIRKVKSFPLLKVLERAIGNAIRSNVQHTEHNAS